ncbi:hypothetical protein R3W88_033422 [Solanum pinnatisectum]|uniref:Uncharacterized protein n=1 Tax=Solanum pinnatisectum TaxID=50273 RepID=A0AAV9K191_9SOLN|nr:hypothetical protein R3W88_033422 [Solanum pinnatisectum]
MEAWRSNGDVGSMWSKTTSYIRKATNEVEIYKAARTEANLAVTSAKTTTFKRKYIELGEYKGRDTKPQDLDQVKYITNEEGKVLMEETLIKQKWQTYSHRLLNGDEDIDIVWGQLEHSKRYRNFGYCRCFKVEEVKQ